MLTDTVADKAAALTVLAPTNTAFGKIDEDALEALLADKDDLTDVRTKSLIVCVLITKPSCTTCVSVGWHCSFRLLN